MKAEGTTEITESTEKAVCLPLCPLCALWFVRFLSVFIRVHPWLIGFGIRISDHKTIAAQKCIEPASAKAGAYE